MNELTIGQVTALIQFDQNSKEYRFLKSLVDTTYENELRNGCSRDDLEGAAKVALRVLSRKLGEMTV